MTSTKPVRADPQFFSTFADFHLPSFYVQAASGTTAATVLSRDFWVDVEDRPGRLKQAGSLIRVRSEDGKLDVQVVVLGFRPMTVARWPIDPDHASSGPGTGMPRTKAEALDLLGLNATASPETITTVLKAQRKAWHPDVATDETDRAVREHRLQRLNAAAALLT